MLQAVLFSLAAGIFVSALAPQVPLAFGQDRQDRVQSSTILDDVDAATWRLDQVPSPNATDHLVFETVHSLLQHWPNTRMRNGHTIVPGIVSKGTLLYHGRSDKEIPPNPDWTATDPEHSYYFCRNLNTTAQSECWHLTLMVTRPLKVLYFDGSSAVKLDEGSMDTEDLFIWGRLSGGNLFLDEVKRIGALCEWGKNFGIDGFARMQMDFEIMLCDFTAGTRVVSFVNLHSGWTNQSLMPDFSEFEVMTSGGWHNRFPGETRIQLDLSRLVSFYDTSLAPSLVPIRAGLDRWDHRTLNTSKEDLRVIKSRMEENLMNSDGASGIDWKTLIQVIVDRYAQRLELTRHLLRPLVSDSNDILDLAKKTQTQLRVMLTPYILLSAIPLDPSDQTESDWTIPIYKLCSTTHTHFMEAQFDSMTNSERLLLQAVRGTSQEVCRVVTKMWAAGVHAGLDPLLNAKESHDIAKVGRIRDTWSRDLDSLMKWLDWSIWTKCDPSCSAEEMCYLPTWPIGFPWLAPFPGPDHILPSFRSQTTVVEKAANKVQNTINPQPDEWVRPQPKCVRRVGPYTY